MDAREKEKIIARARQQLRQHAPFLDFVLEHIVLRSTDAVPVARVCFVPPRYVMELNLAYLATLPLDQQATVLEHELRHILHHHLGRRGERDPLRWNVACDYAINSFLPLMPVDALRPPSSLWGKKAEDIYERLPDQVAPTESTCLEFPPVGSGPALDSAYGRLLGAAQRQFGSARVAETLARLAVGNIPETTAEELTSQDGVGINWRDLLTRYARLQGRRRTLLRPNRRGLSSWGTQRPRLLRVVVALDTSGSISASLGAAFLAELYRLRPLCASLTVLMADAAVQAVCAFEALDGQGFTGRGGTDYTPAIAYVNSHLVDHDLCVYLTDGQGPLPSVRATIPLVWVVTDNREFPGRPAVFVHAP